MPAPPSRELKTANQRSMDAARSYGGINTSTVKTQDRGSTNSYGKNEAQRQAEERSNYRSPPASTGLSRMPGVQPGGGGVSQAPVMRQQMMGKPLIRPSPQPLLGVPGRGRVPLSNADINYFDLDRQAPPAPAMAIDPQIAGRLAATKAPGYGVPDLPIRGNTIYKTPFSAPVAQDPSIAGRLAQAQEPTSDIPIPRQNPLSNTDLFKYQKNRGRDYVFGGMDQEAISRAVKAQELFGSPVIPTSGMRNPLLNKKVGGAKGSQHMQGLAIDFSIPDTTGEDTARLITAMKEAGFTGIGGYRPGKVHGDIGDPRMWGPDTHASSISQLPKNMQIAMAGGVQPKQTVARVLAPIVKKSVTGLKNLLSPQDIPIPRQKPMVPSIVAQAQGTPIPQMKPRVPSIVAKATSIPVPRQKPEQQMARIEPAVAPPTPQQAMSDSSPSFWQQGKDMVMATLLASIFGGMGGTGGNGMANMGGDRGGNDMNQGAGVLTQLLQPKQPTAAPGETPVIDPQILAWLAPLLQNPKAPVWNRPWNA